MSEISSDQGSTAVVESTEPMPRALTPVRERDETTSITADSNGAQVFSKDADLAFRLKSGTGHVEYKVNKFNVASASDAFGRLVFNENGGADIIDLDDDLAAFAVIMNIVHYRFALVKKQPTMDELYRVCIVVSKYECTHLIQPWADRWTAILVDSTASDTTTMENHKALWVAWVLGCVIPFRQMSDSLIVTSKVDEDGDLVHIGGFKVKELTLPMNLLDGIVDVRSKTVAALLEAIKKPMDHLTGSGPKQEGVTFCKVGTEAVQCEMMLLAAASRIFFPAGLYPVPAVDKFMHSVSSIKDAVAGIRYQAWVGKAFAPHKAHTGCNLGLMDSLATILKEMPSPVNEAHLTHLAKQAELTGVDNGDNLEGYGSKVEPQDEANASVDVGTDDQTKGAEDSDATAKASESDEDAKVSEKADTGVSEEEV
ncbi:Endo-1,6-beta-D-glucanase neg1 [Pestalotiopsis sp. IQ-011]